MAFFSCTVLIATFAGLSWATGTDTRTHPFARVAVTLPCARVTSLMTACPAELSVKRTEKSLSGNPLVRTVHSRRA